MKRFPAGLYATATAFLPLVLVLNLYCAAAGAAPAIQHWETAHGARVYFVPAPELPIVDVELVFDGGSARDGAKGGISQLTNTLLDDGAGDLDADELAERFEDIGAQFSTDAQRDMATVSLRSLSDEATLKTALDTLVVVLKSPTFPEDGLNRERNRMLTALRGEQQSPEAIAEKAFFKAVYGDHPYANEVLGTPESLATLTRADVVSFYRRYYVARNAVIAIVGDLDRARAESTADRLAAALDTGARAPTLPPVPRLESAKTVHIDHPSTQTHVLIGQPGMKRGDPDYFALYVGNHVLGGSGLVSRISDEIREKRGLAYSAYSYFFPMHVAGPFMMGLQTRTEKTSEAIALLQKTLRKYIDEGPTAEELKASKQNITGGFPLRLDSNAKIIGNLAVIGFYGLPLDYLDTFNRHVEAVSVKDIRDAFRRRIDPDDLVTVTVGSGTTN